MPSLRRTSSSPAVRSAPYPTSLSEQAAVLRARGSGGPRRPSGSDMAGRQVLADIGWWLVFDGQCSADTERHDADDGAQDSDRDPEQVPARAGPTPAHIQADLALTWDSLLAESSEAILSVVPTTPPRTRHSRQSSASSLASTPELAEPTVLEGMRLDLEYLDLSAQTSEPRRTQTHSLVDLLAQQMQNDHEAPYADFSVSPLSSRFPTMCN